MKEAGNVDDLDLLLSDMIHHEKTILADLEMLGNVTADKEWRENAAKVCSAICTLVQSAEFPTQLCDMIVTQVRSDYICLSMAFVFAESERFDSEKTAPSPKPKGLFFCQKTGLLS